MQLMGTDPRRLFRRPCEHLISGRQFERILDYIQADFRCNAAGRIQSSRRTPIRLTVRQ